MRLLALSILLLASTQTLISAEEPPSAKPSTKDVQAALTLAVKYYDDPDLLTRQISLLEQNTQQNKTQLNITRMALRAIKKRSKGYLQTQVDLKDHVFPPGKGPGQDSKL